jgi:hypothetical protein
MAMKTEINPSDNYRKTNVVKIFDEIGQAMIGNPLNPPDPTLVGKLVSMGDRARYDSIYPS